MSYGHEPLRVVNAMVSDRKGGMERAFLNIADCLTELGWETENWLPATSPYFNESRQFERFYDFHPRGYFDLFATVRARLQLRKFKPDLILAHNSRATTILARAARSLEIPVVCFAHSEKFKRIKSADYIVCLTATMAHQFEEQGFPAERLKVFPNILLELPAKPSISSHRLSGAPVLGFLGRLAPEKGLLDLLEALSILEKEGRKLLLKIAGSGDDYEKIKSLTKDLNIENLVQFDGWVEEIGDWFSSVDLCVAPSRHESFGIVILEAAAYGCPVISTQVSGPASQIQHDVDGWLVEPGRPDLLADMIDYAVKQKDRWPNIVANAYVRAKRYSKDDRLGDLEAILLEISSKSKPQ